MELGGNERLLKRLLPRKCYSVEDFAEYIHNKIMTTNCIE